MSGVRPPQQFSRLVPVAGALRAGRLHLGIGNGWMLFAGNSSLDAQPTSFQVIRKSFVGESSPRSVPGQ